MYEKYLEQLEEAGKIRNLKERSISCYKNYVSYFLKYQNKNPKGYAGHFDRKNGWQNCKDSELWLSVLPLFSQAKKP